MRVKRLLLCVASLALGACSLNQGLRPGHEFGTVVHTIGEETGERIDAAHIYEIDGESVLHQRRHYTLSPGEHSVRVWPEGPAQRMVPDLEQIEREDIRVDAITLRVVAGYRYFLAAKTTRTRSVVTVVTEEGEQTERSQWQVTVQPVVVREEPPVDVERAAKGLGGFVGSLLLGPLVAN